MKCWDCEQEASSFINLSECLCFAFCKTCIKNRWNTKKKENLVQDIWDDLDKKETSQ